MKCAPFVESNEYGNTKACSLGKRYDKNVKLYIQNDFNFLKNLFMEEGLEENNSTYLQWLITTW